MQRSFSILLGLFLSLLVFYGGSGVNAYFYCCSDCRVEGNSAVAEHKCCDIHQLQLDGCCPVTHHENHACDLIVGESHGECGVDRIAFDWQTSPGSQIQLQPAVVDLEYTLFSFARRNRTIDENFSPSPWSNRPTQKPPNLGKDEYFSLLTILII